MSENIKASIFIFIAAFAAYTNSLSGGFINWDDTWLIVSNPYLADLSLIRLLEVLTPFSDRYTLGAEYLPIRDLSWIIDSIIWEKDPFGYHLGNVLLHSINSVFVFLIGRKINMSISVSFFAALLFAIHPIHSEAVAWASSRKDVLSAFFFLLSFLCFAKEKRLFWYISLILYVLAVLSKYPAVVLPGILIGYTILKQPVKNNYISIIIKITPFIVAGMFLIVLAVFVAKVQVQSVIPQSFIFSSVFSKIASYSLVFTWYLQNLLFPIELSAVYDFNVNIGGVLLLLLPVLAFTIIISIILSVKKNKVLLFWVFFYLSTMVVFLGIFPIKVIMADRYIYLPSIGFCFLISYFFMEYYYSTKSTSINIIIKYKKILFIVLCIFFTVLTINRNYIWNNDGSFWSDTVSKSPMNPTVLLGYANHLREEKKYTHALKIISAAQQLDIGNTSLKYECDKLRRLIKRAMDKTGR